MRHPDIARLILCLSACWFASSIAAAETTLEGASTAAETVATGIPIEGYEGDLDFPFFRTEYRLVQGYRSEELDWNIGLPTIDVLSELEWEDLQSAFVRLEATVLMPRRLYLRGHLQHGWIRDGRNQDSDFLLPGRMGEFSRSNNEAGGGDVSDVSIGIGWRAAPIRLMRETYMFGLSVGYAYSEQNLVIRDGFQTIPLLGPFPNLRSKYGTRWFGPWVGIEVVGTSPYTRLILTGSLEYHFVFYEGVGDWNLRPDLDHPDSFEHDAHGRGLVAQLGLKRDIGEHLFVGLGVEWALFSTDGGDDITNFSDGSSVEIDFNEVNWSAFSAKLTFGVAF